MRSSTSIFNLVLMCCTFTLAEVSMAQKAATPPKSTSEAEQGGIVYGSNFAYMISAPKGWIMDDVKARQLGLSVLFYRRGETWEKGNAVMYVNAVGRKKGVSTAKVIADDIAETKKNGGLRLTVRLDKPVASEAQSKATTYLFHDVDAKTIDERISYVETPTVILLIVLTSKTTKDFKKSVADHKTLVQSEHFLEIKFENGKPN